MIQDTAKKEQFIRDAMPHLDAIWQTADWLFEIDQDAEKVTEDVFKEAYKLWDMSISETARKLWFFKILIRELHNKVTLSFRSRFMDDIDDESVSISTDKIESIKLIPGEIVSRAIRNLPVENRLVFILSFCQKFSYSEIANIIGVSKKVVSFAIYKGCKQIRKELTNYTMTSHTTVPFAKCS